ncbi:MAG: HEAT repeat domain-containing protein [Thermoguttaceae bacterium]|jgi:HEAT repeat protein
MVYRVMQLVVAAAALALTSVSPAAPEKGAASGGLDKSFEALKAYDWGQDRAPLRAIEDAAVATHGDAAARKDLETRLVAAIKDNSTRGAKDFICRQLSVVGTAESVPALAVLLTDKDNSHMARYALERIPGPEAVKAMREAVRKTSGAVKAGIIGSLGVRRDTESVPAMIALLGDSDKTVAIAAAGSLGAIGTPDAAKALGDFLKKAPEDVNLAVADGCLACAERLLADGKKADAMAIYKSLAGQDQPKHIRLAATRGLLSVAGKKE